MLRRNGAGLWKYGPEMNCPSRAFRADAGKHGLFPASARFVPQSPHHPAQSGRDAGAGKKLTRGKDLITMITKLANLVIFMKVNRMPYGTYDDTHQRILASGRKMFLENGFERTNLRNLCADAGVTTGSFYRHFESKEDLFAYFVQPAVDEIRNDFAGAEEPCREAVETGDIRRLWMIMDADRLLDYIYRNFDALKLLLSCADGTPYSSFLNDVVSMETDISLRSLTLAKERGYILAEIPSEPEMHMLCHAYVSCVFESVLHNLSREDMEKYIHTIVKFFTAGSYRVLGL